MSKTDKDGKIEKEKRAKKRDPRGRRVETHGEKGGHANPLRTEEDEALLDMIADMYGEGE